MINNTENKIATLEEFITKVRNMVNGLKDYNEVSNIWFRGECSVNILTPLVPKLYRVYNDPDSNEVYTYALNLEGNIKSEFAIRSVPYFQRENIKYNNWNCYFLMQHYGLETRLLDWTESALIALFFAIENLNIKEDCVVWLLNPHRLNKFTTRELHPEKIEVESIISPSDNHPTDLHNTVKGMDLYELAKKYLNLDFDEKKFYPYALFPPILDNRMNTQSSCFTIFGNVVNGLLSIDKSDHFLNYIRIDGSRKRQIKEELRWLGISQKTIYPDLEGLSKSISDKYNSDHLILKRTK